MIEIIILALSIGSICFEVFGIPISKVFVLGLLLGIFLAMFFHSRKGIFFSMLVGGAFTLGGIYTKLEYKQIPTDIFSQGIFTGKVLKIEEKIGSTTLIFRTGGNKINVIYRGHKEVLPGDRIVIKGGLQEIKDFEADGGRIFEYEKYMKSRGIVATMYDPEIEIVESGNIDPIRLATQARKAIAQTLSDRVDFPVDGMIGGMLIGSKGAIPEETEDLFKETGVLHVLVLSGYNITVVAGLLGVILKKVPMNVRLILIAISILGIVLISGAGVAAIRAGIMGSMALLSTAMLRGYDPLRAIFISYLAFFLISPLMIIYDPGFHMSFLATIFIVTFMKKISFYFSSIPTSKIVDIKEIILLSVFMPLFMLPYTAFFSGTFSFASIPANVLFALISPVLMFLGAMTLLPFGLSKVFSILATYFGEKVFYVLEFLSLIKTIHAPAISGWSVLLVYLVLIFIFFRKEIKSYVRRLRTWSELPSSSFD